MCLNALAILSESRFLPKLGLAPPPNTATGNNQYDQSAGGNFGVAGAQKPVSPACQQISSFLASIRMLVRWPLIIINWIFVVLIILSY